MSIINLYNNGDVVRVTATFVDAAGAAMDPTTVRFKFKAPGAATVTYTYGAGAEIIKDSTGNYHADLPADTAGKWLYRWESTGTGKAAGEGQFMVAETAL